MIEPLNFSRNVINQLQSERKKGVGQLLSTAEQAYVPGALIRNISSAAKFKLPDGGRVLDDKGLRAITGNDVRFPYESIALEWVDFDGTKNVLLSREEKSSGSETFDMALFMLFSMPEGGDEWISSFDAVPLDHETWHLLKSQGSDHPFWVIFDMLNALACANVRVDTQPARKQRKKAKNPLPFDSYHYLTVEIPGRAPGQGAGTGDRRSPREHIRRGHIRRLTDGRAIWINATMVNTGIGSKVDKAYVMRRGA